ncbi:beta-galactosidase [Lacticaseibacillus suihuaensis]
MRFDVDARLLHGGDYNPDQWLDYPDVLQEDLKLMQKAHINTVTLGVFAWSALEPADGQFEFGWLDKVFEDVNAMGGNVILATPSGARPQWLSEKYPEVNRVDDQLRRHTHGFRHDHCYSSPIYRQYVARIDRELAKRYGHNPALAMWHVSNEFSGECFCDLCQTAWRDWLRHKYGSLKAVNDAWLMSFWGGTYSAWEQIKTPNALGSTKVHGMALDWKRFVTDRTIDFYDAEVKVLKRENPAIPATTNFMAEGPGHDFIPLEGIDYAKFAEHVDLVSWDAYPQWNNNFEPLAETALKTAFVHDTFYGLKNQPFLVMEATPSRVNSPVAKAKRPGVHALSSFQQIAHGSEGSLYFQFRQARANSEKFHSAVVGHDGDANNRVFREVAAYGARLATLDGVKGTKRVARVAIVYDWQSLWAQKREAAFGRDRKKYFQTLEDHYAYFWQHDIPVAMVPSDHDFSGFDLVIAPMLYVMTKALAKRLSDYVQGGGTLVSSYFTGIVDPTDTVILGGWPQSLQRLFGIHPLEFDSLYEGEHNAVSYGDQSYETTQFAQVLEATGAQVLATYQRDFYQGSPAVTCNAFGAGQAYYIAPRTGRDLLAALYQQVATDLGLRPTLVATANPVVSVQARGAFNFVMNMSATVQTVTTTVATTDAEDGSAVAAGVLTLAPYAVRVLRQ